jgi:AraC family transcriptional regulator
MILRIASAGERFGNVIANREVGAFRLRESGYASSLNLPPHRHPEPYFSYVVHGAIEEHDSRGNRSYAEGSVHFHPSDDAHWARTGPHGLVCLSLAPSGPMTAALDAHSRRTAADTRWLASLAARCHEEFRASDAASDLALEGLCLELVAASLRQSEREGDRMPGWLERAREFLHAHLDRRIRIGELATEAGVHEAHLARTFRKYTGCSPGSYLRRLRVERARVALTASGTSLVEIALEAGFCSQSHFTRVFHRQVGMSPGAYRLRYGRPRARSN